MAVLNIVRMGHPVLRRRAEEIMEPDLPGWAALAADMTETMDEAGGVGLAAPQVNQDVRLVVFRIPRERQNPDEPSAPFETQVLINPEWVPLDEDGEPMPEPELDDPELDLMEVLDIAENVMEEGLEGCLSIPGLRGLVPRYPRIRYRGIDLEGRIVERDAEGFHARVVQHEIDHLDGILFIDRMADLETLCFESELHYLLEDDRDPEAGLDERV